MYFFFCTGPTVLISGAELLLAEWSTAAVLFPLHTTLLSSLCAGGMILFTSRATIIFYLLVECGLLAVGMAYPPVSLFLPPYWGMAQAMGDSFQFCGGGQCVSVDRAEPWHYILAESA